MCGPREEFQLNGKKALSSHSTRAKDRSLSAVATGQFLFCLYREKYLRIQPLLDKCRRPQSGFTAGRSTMDAILALRLLTVILIDNLMWHILILSQHLIQLTGYYYYYY